MFGALVGSMLDIWPGEPISLQGDLLLRPLANVLAGAVLAAAGFLSLLKFLPKGSLWSGMVLEAAVAGEPAAIRALHVTGRGELAASDLLGCMGTVVTALFPSGQVEISGVRYEAKVAVGYADAGTPVRVTGVGEFGLVVEVMS